MGDFSTASHVTSISILRWCGANASSRGPPPLFSSTASLTDSPSIRRDGRRPTELLHDVQPEDLLKFGLIPEFIGRLPVIATLHEAVVRALAAPEVRDKLVAQGAEPEAFWLNEGLSQLAEELGLLPLQAHGHLELGGLLKVLERDVAPTAACALTAHGRRQA